MCVGPFSEDGQRRHAADIINAAFTDIKKQLKEKDVMIEIITTMADTVEKCKREKAKGLYQPLSCFFDIVPAI